MKSSSHLSNVRDANPGYFSRENKRFFNDVNYSVLRSRTGNPYLLTSTYKWSDMFGGPRTLFYVVKPINPDTLEIGQSLKDDFTSRKTAKEFIKRQS